MKQEQCTLTSRRNDKAIQLTGFICHLLNWTPDQFAQFQYDTGLKYLSCYLDGDQLTYDLLERSTFFWKWWRNSWVNRDSVFIEYVHRISPTMRAAIYKGLHDPGVLACEIYPHRVILEESFSEMAHRLTKSHHHA